MGIFLVAFYFRQVQIGQIFLCGDEACGSNFDNANGNHGWMFVLGSFD